MVSLLLVASVLKLGINVHFIHYKRLNYTSEVDVGSATIRSPAPIHQLCARHPRVCRCIAILSYNIKARFTLLSTGLIIIDLN
jgi:hypothetical protein